MSYCHFFVGRERLLRQKDTAPSRGLNACPIDRAIILAAEKTLL